MITLPWRVSTTRNHHLTYVGAAVRLVPGVLYPLHHRMEEQGLLPSSWESNGGTIARLMVVGTKMFIRAPARYYARIEWILGQLADGEPTAQRAGSGAR